MDQAVQGWSVELRTLDGQSLLIDCAPDQTLVEAADQARWRLPVQCRQGQCGACHARVVSGEYTLGPHNPAALPAGQPGSVLMCCTTAHSPLVVQVPFERSRIASGAVPRREAEITELHHDGEHTIRLSLRLLPEDGNSDDGCAAEFEPGQFAELEVPFLDLKRAYSLANTANWEGRLAFLIRLQPGGRFSTWLREQAQVGDKLVVHGPQGAFGLQENGLRPRWFVAGGTGLAPLLSMLRRMAEFGEPQPARLYFGVTHESELFGADLIDELLAQLPTLQVTRCVWQPAGDWSGFHGTAVDAWAQDLARLAPGGEPDVYVCGPPGLVKAAEAAATAGGLPTERLLVERFTPG